MNEDKIAAKWALHVAQAAYAAAFQSILEALGANEQARVIAFQIESNFNLLQRAINGTKRVGG